MFRFGRAQCLESSGVATANAYLKGKTGAARFNYDYRNEEITEIAQRCALLTRSARELHVIFNNNCLDYAPRAVHAIPSKSHRIGRYN
jgi:uncharacterized protein YecE (DUF72 family)